MSNSSNEEKQVSSVVLKVDAEEFTEDGPVIAIVGATGAVGREMLSILHERQTPCRDLKLLASEKSAGEIIEFGSASLTVEELNESSFEGVDIALFSAGGCCSEKFAPIAVESGAIVIDNSSFFRMDPAVPLVVPEVNPAEVDSFLATHKGRGGIIANPNCSTVQLVVALKPIQQAAGLKRLIVSTYQSVSGAGRKGMDELWNQTLAVCNQGDVVSEAFSHQIAFNCIPHCDVFLENGYTKEEMKVVHETRKILGLPELPVTCTAVRVPVFLSHGESVNIETERALTAEEAKDLLRSSPGVLVVDDPSDNLYPMAKTAAGSDATFVGRIREDESIENGLNMWIVADNLRKGAALNAVQIAELVIAERRE